MKSCVFTKKGVWEVLHVDYTRMVLGLIDGSDTRLLDREQVLTLIRAATEVICLESNERRVDFDWSGGTYVTYWKGDKVHQEYRRTRADDMIHEVMFALCHIRIPMTLDELLAPPADYPTPE